MLDGHAHEFAGDFDEGALDTIPSGLALVV